MFVNEFGLHFEKKAAVNLSTQNKKGGIDFNE